MDVYFSADVETDGPIPGPYSILTFAMVYAGSYDGVNFRRPVDYETKFYRELKPISTEFQTKALQVNGLDRYELMLNGVNPENAMTDAYDWVRGIAQEGNPVLVAYPLSFDWSWLYWYFVKFCYNGSPFGYSQCFDVKTAVAVKTGQRIGEAGRSRLPKDLQSKRRHTHHSIDDAIEQAEIFANIFEWRRA